MMSVLEYANDVNKTVSEILNLCKKLNIEANNEDDYLDEEAIIELDNSLDEIEEAEELEDLEISLITNSSATRPPSVIAISSKSLLFSI